MHRFPFAIGLIAVAVLVAGACHRAAPSGEYLFVWAGDSARAASDFLVVVDANPSSKQYGTVLATLPTGVVGAYPHHTEAEMPSDGHLLANGFGAGRTWLFDLTSPRQPKLLTSFGDVAGLSHPHTYTRLANGNVLATFQYAANELATATSPSSSVTAAATASAAAAAQMSMPMPTLTGATHTTGGLVEMDERGAVIRRGSASDATIQDKLLFPYSVLALPSIDRAVSTTTDMDHADTVATSQWVQFWRLSDLTLIKSIALAPGPRGDEHKFSGEPRLLPDGKSVYIHTFNCGLYLVRGIERAAPSATFVKGFKGIDCGVPILTSHYWLQPVPALHALVALDIADPEHPREVSSVSVGDDEEPHWIAIDATGRRIVLNSAGAGLGNRIFVINFDPADGALSIDARFRDAGAPGAGISMRGKSWPHGWTGTAVPHGSVFSR